jgi:hypothetical protein
MTAVFASLVILPAPRAAEPAPPPAAPAPEAAKPEEALAGAPPAGEAGAPPGTDRSSHEAMSDLYKLFQRTKPTTPPPAK